MLFIITLYYVLSQVIGQPLPSRTLNLIFITKFLVASFPLSHARTICFLKYSSCDSISHVSILFFAALTYFSFACHPSVPYTALGPPLPSKTIYITLLEPYYYSYPTCFQFTHVVKKNNNLGRAFKYVVVSLPTTSFGGRMDGSRCLPVKLPSLLYFNYPSILYRAISACEDP